MPDGNLYESDFHAWTVVQAEKLRAAAKVQVPELEGVDFEHIIEEVEDLGISERRQVTSNLSVALEHMIKISTLPHTDFVRGWRNEAIAAIRNARRAFSPSMIQRIDATDIWNEAREDALQKLIEDGVSASDVSVEPPLTLEQMLVGDLSAIELIDIVISKMPSDLPEIK
jgi:hypothetical protein